MKPIVFALLSLTLISALPAKDTEPAKQKSIDFWVTSPEEKTQRDASGRIVGTVDKSSTGTVTRRDASGRIVETSSKSTTGSTTYRDGSGRITKTDSTSSTGTTTTRDGSGRIIAT